ncbi:MAG: AI-2E family transporter [Eubacteriales bacterium]|nr:AI-2E family transporter [Eubacteriales bacterium]
MLHGCRNLIKIVGITVAVYFLMRYMLPVVFPFLLAGLLVRLVMPWSLFLQKKLHIKKEIAGLVLIILLCFGVGIALYFLGCGLIRQMTGFAANIEKYMERARSLLNGCCGMVEKQTGIHAAEVQSFLYDNIEVLGTRMRTTLVPGMVKNSISCFMIAMKWLGEGLVILVSVAMILKDYDGLREKLMEYPLFCRIRKLAQAMQSLGGAWLRAQLLIILLVTVICTVGLWLLHYPYALLLGVVIGLLDAFPFIGTGTVLIPWGIYCLIRGDFVYGAGLLVIFTLTNTLREYLEPKLIGERIGVLPIFMVAAVYIGLRVFGTVGVLLGPISLMLIFELYRECDE